MNQNLPVSERVKNLQQQMTWEEKLTQTFCFHLYDDMMDEQGNLVFEDDIMKTLPLGVGQLGKPNWAFDKEAKESAEITNKIQKRVIEGNRFGIPAIFHEEALHGLWARGSTVFPQAIGMSCSWDPDLVNQVFRVIAKEIRSRGSHQANTPMLDICRDPRWGRIEESYGEDPYLTSRFAVAIVKGLQGTEESINKDHIIATAKHFAGYGLTEGGLNKTPLYISERTMREIVLPPFKAAITEAGALSVMPSYNEIDGIPSHANKWLLTDILRDEWNFKGYVVSDYGGVVQLGDGFHPVAANRTNAGKLALLAGVDMELDNPYCFSTLLESVKSSEDLQKALNRAVKGVLTVKFKLGLFDDPYTDPGIADEFNRRNENLQLALKAAEESIVLLKNENSILPLDKSKYKKIAIIGPHANTMHYGGYAHHDTKNGITFYKGIKKLIGNDIEIVTAEGCRIHEGDGYWLTSDYDEFEFTDPEENEKRISEALQLAKQCDLVILAVGGTAVTCGEFIGYRHDLDLFGQQNELVDIILGSGIPTIVCLVNGRPLTVNTINSHANAVLETWYLGEQAGTALAKTLFGVINPSGKLTLTFPRSVGHLPVYYSKKQTAIHDYFAEETNPLYPFGYGLSYTQFEYSNCSFDKQSLKVNDKIEISFSLKNSGNYEGKEIVQLYIRDKISSVTRPIKELKGFKKVNLKPGEKKKVNLTLYADDLKFYDVGMNHVLEPGEFEIMIGSSSTDIRLKKSITVVE
jgi:beta-glucosidase